MSAKRLLNRRQLIALALRLPGAGEDYPFGDGLLTVKVGGRVFAWIPLTDEGWLGSGIRVAVKLPPTLVAELRQVYPEDVHAARPLSERHWVAVHLGGRVDGQEVAELVRTSYAEVVARLPRRLRPPQ